MPSSSIQASGITATLKNYGQRHPRQLGAGLLAIGVIILLLAIKLKPSVPVHPGAQAPRLVEVMSLTQASAQPQITGYGRAEPKLVWQALAEVSGEVVYRLPALEKGRFLKAGTELLRVDPLEYELALAQAQADLSSAKTQLARLEQQTANTELTLEIETSRLGLAKQELERQKKLRKQGLTSQSTLDTQKQSYLSQTKVVQELENQLTLLPDDIEVAKATIRVSEARVKDAERTLAKTKVVLPFDARIAEVNIEQGQVVNLQQVMVEAHGLEITEVEAQVAIHDLAKLMRGQRSRTMTGELPDVSKLALFARVTLQSGDVSVSWPAKVTRFSDTVNPNQATVGVILEVSQSQNPDNPPLVKGMFLEATLKGKAREAFMVPERALRGSSLYTMTEDNELRIIPVTVLYRSGNQVAIAGALESGMSVVLNDLIPAVDGMPLKVVEAN